MCILTGYEELYSNTHARAHTLLLPTAATAVYILPVRHSHAAEVICGFSGQSQNYNRERPDVCHSNFYDSPRQRRNF